MDDYVLDLCHFKGHKNETFAVDDRRLWIKNEDLLILRHVAEFYKSQFRGLDDYMDNVENISIENVDEFNYQHSVNIKTARRS